ncbi:MAG: sigma-70 family RNA polymerase sigma factor, partial [Myxococcales bacterium]
ERDEASTDDEDGERSDEDDDDQGEEPAVDAAAELGSDGESDDDGGLGGSVAEGGDSEGYLDREAGLAIPLSSPRARDRGDRDEDDEREEREANKASALSRNDPMQAYLREVQRHPLLTPDEEQSLARRYAATQDVDAAARMVTANLRLVVKIAYEYRRAYKNIMDLVQEGNIGLMQAVKKYDPNRGVKLSSYSAWWIRAYILRYIINNWRLVKLGTTQAQRKLFFNLNKEKARLSAMGIDPTPDRIAKNLGVEEQEAIDMDRRLSSGEMSLDAPVGDNEGRPVSRIELMPSATAGPDSAVADGELNEIVHEKLVEFRATLKGKDLDIFDKRLVADEPLTLQELGDQFGISRERVRQIEARLTMHLRTFLVAALGDAVEV